MRPRRHHVLVALVAVLAGAHVAVAASAGKACLKSCKFERKNCLRVAGEHDQVVRASCPPASPASKSCLRTAHRLLGSARKSCTRLRADCKACCRAGGTGPRCPVGRAVSFTPPPPQNLDAMGVPKLPNGRYLALAIPGATLEIDPSRRDPITVLGACTAWIAGCADQVTRNLDDCARSAPPCATERPWEEAQVCCPTACFEAYQRARRAGVDPITAARDTYFHDASCFPGVAAARGRSRP